jgi:hypothetical protein
MTLWDASGSLHPSDDLYGGDANQHGLLKIEACLSLFDLLELQIHASQEFLELRLFETRNAHAIVATI